MYTYQVHCRHRQFSAYIHLLYGLQFFPRKFAFICIVFNYLSVDTVHHHTLQYTVVYGTHSGWCWWERSKVAREWEHTVYYLDLLVLNNVLVNKSWKWFPLLFFLVGSVHMLFILSFNLFYMYIHNCVQIMFKMWYMTIILCNFFSVLPTWCRVPLREKML